MKKHVIDHLDTLMAKYPALAGLRPAITKAYETIVDCHRRGGKTLVCGNGGSAADSEHIVGELMKGFLLKRPVKPSVAQRLRRVSGSDADALVAGLQEGISAISLVSHVSLITAIANDNGAEFIYAQQVLGYGRPGDVLIGISTSGNARNVCLALKTAAALEMTTIGLTGQGGGAMGECCDILIDVPITGPYKVQEYHMPTYHALCMMVEAELFDA